MNAEHFRRLARYNRWANRRLYEACGRLSTEDYFAPRSGFFPSIHKTLNHLLVADRIWNGRLDGQPSGITQLDLILFDGFGALRSAREAEDERFLRIVTGLDDAAVGESLHYFTTEGEPKQLEIERILTHVINHQTHHRGQVHAMLAGTPVPPPPIDLLYFYPEDRS